MIRANIVHDREETMAKFLNGLNRDIKNIIESQHYIELKYVVHIAIKLERQLKRKGVTQQVVNLGFFFIMEVEL